MSLETGAVRYWRLSSSYEQVRAFCFAFNRAIASRQSRPETPAVQNEAVGFLTNSKSELDEREWAERYLCGMAGADKGAFMKDRKWQS